LLEALRWNALQSLTCLSGLILNFKIILTQQALDREDLVYDHSQMNFLEQVQAQVKVKEPDAIDLDHEPGFA
jgi:hypothetical protein